MTTRSGERRFDEAYYRRFYGAPSTRVCGPEQVAHLGAALVEMIAWYRGRLRSVLEVGAGVGLLRDWFAVAHPAVRYVSTDSSPYAAEKYRHEQRDIAVWRGRHQFDLVVCQAVLPYLPDRAVGAAINNLAAMTRGFLYLEAITRRDYDTSCDRAKTDPEMLLRPAEFYRRRLARHFQTLGGGLYYLKRGPLVFWELETL
jgi:hypothetical protein